MTTKTTNRIHYTVHGQRGQGARVTSGYAIRRDDYSRRSEIVADAISRKARARVYTMRHDSDNIRRDGSVESSTYEVTLVGSGSAQGGYPVVGSLWVTIYTS